MKTSSTSPATPARLVAILLTAAVVLLGFGPTGRAPEAGAADGDTFTFTGGGFGHGVGMSQYGAYGRAAAGYTYGQILTAYYTGTQISTVRAHDDIRVRLGLTSSPVTLTPSARTPVRLDGVPQGNPSAPITVRATNGMVETAFGGPCPAGACLGTKLVVPLTVGKPVGVSVTGHRYHRGRIEITNVGGSLFVVVRGMTMDEYLYGLAEVPRSWPMEALRAQAVAGRSYAQARATARRSAGNGFDLYYTTSDQYYTGYEVESAVGASRWIEAVDTTTGRMVTYQGAVITAYYSSSNGGHSEHSEYVWATALPWARGIPDPFDAHENPLGQWTREYSRDELSDWLSRSTSTDVGRVQSITVEGPLGVSGRVDKATVVLVGSEGTRTVSGAQLRAVINIGAAAGGLARQLPSTNFRLGDTGTRAAPTAPQGSLESVRAVALRPRLRISGWALDRNSDDPVTLHTYVDGVHVDTRRARLPRPDIESRFGLGAEHGFDFRLDVGLGTHQVCVWALNIGGGGAGNTRLGCRSVTITDHVPTGRLETIGQVPGPGTGVVTGWAYDRDASARSVRLHVYVDGTHVDTGVTDQRRTDVAVVHGVGRDQGFRIEFPIDPGQREVCVYAINLGPGRANQALGCEPLTVREFVEIQPIEVDQVGERIE